MTSAQICVARIGAPHGVRGQVRLWTFTEDPFAVLDYGPLATKDGKRSFEVDDVREAKGHLVATLKGVASREDAERLNGVELFVARDALPDTEDDEYYHADLIGLAAVNAAGDSIGRVVGIHNFGAGDILDIELENGKSEMIPLRDEFIGGVHEDEGYLVIFPPEYLEADSK